MKTKTTGKRARGLVLHDDTWTKWLKLSGQSTNAVDVKFRALLKVWESTPANLRGEAITAAERDHVRAEQTTAPA